MEENRNKRRYLKEFNPDVCELSNCKHQDFLLSRFDAGEGFENFSCFITEEAEEYAENGEGATYVVFNVFQDEQNKVCNKEIVAYFTLAATSIPYEDRIRLDEDEVRELGKEFDVQTCGIPSVEIKMFAVDEKYQDVFYVHEGEELPVSAWIIRRIVYEAEKMLKNTVGYKALFLHTVPNAKMFYEKNGFHPVKLNMKPLHSVDSDLEAMYLTLRDVKMNYDY